MDSFFFERGQNHDRNIDWTLYRQHDSEEKHKQGIWLVANRKNLFVIFCRLKGTVESKSQNITQYFAIGRREMWAKKS